MHCKLSYVILIMALSCAVYTLLCNPYYVISKLCQCFIGPFCDLGHVDHRIGMCVCTVTV